jgi:hypothetical protein
MSANVMAKKGASKVHAAGDKMTFKTITVVGVQSRAQSADLGMFECSGIGSSSRAMIMWSVS